MLAYDQFRKDASEPDGQTFDSRLLLPRDHLDDERRFDLIVLPLHFQGEQLGFVVMSMGPDDGSLYDALRIQISSALRGHFWRGTMSTFTTRRWLRVRRRKKPTDSRAVSCPLLATSYGRHLASLWARSR